MPVKKLKDFLDDHGVKYVSIAHSKAYTTQEIAAATHIPGKDVAKTVMVKLDDQIAMAVLPAPDQVSFTRLKHITGAQEARLASEAEFQSLFPGCELGAMPPFGNIWGIPVFVDQRLREDELIAFNAGTHTEVVQLAYADFERLAHPVVANLSTRN